MTYEIDLSEEALRPENIKSQHQAQMKLQAARSRMNVVHSLAGTALNELAGIDGDENTKELVAHRLRAIRELME